MIYGDNTVTHVWNEKAYARASRGHDLAQSMLTRILIRETYAPPPPSDDDVLNPDLQMTLELFIRMMDKRIAQSQVFDNPVICEIAKGAENTNNKN